jgi:hypothetical protein
MLGFLADRKKYATKLLHKFHQHFKSSFSNNLKIFFKALFVTFCYHEKYYNILRLLIIDKDGVTCSIKSFLLLP